MDAAVGVPKEFADQEWGNLTPMMSQYVQLCDEYDSELLLFHVGDFYKAFGEAAEVVARICELNLTTREDNTGEYAMAGLRVESAETHLQKLLDAGYRIAIAEQVEDPDAVSGVADRAVTQVVTPGTLTESELLDPVEHNFVMALTCSAGAEGPADADSYGLAFLDVSTGACYTTTISSERALQDEVSRVQPVEVLVGPDLSSHGTLLDRVLGPVGCERTAFDPAAFDESRARAKVAEYFGQLQGSTGPSAGVRATGALLQYAEYTRGGQDEHLAYISQLQRYDPQEFLQMNDVALRGLELFERRGKQSPEGATLVEVIDECVTAVGSRTLREWLRRPLVEQDRIEARHESVAELTADEFTRGDLRELLERVYDIERLSSKIARGRADARDLRSLHDSLAVLPEIKATLAECDASLLTTLHEELPDMGEVRTLIDEAITPDPPTELTEGGLIREGYNDDLDELRETVEENQAWIENLEAAERERTGIENLRVGHTEVHGYYIEVTNSNLDAVPDDYTRRQTLKNAERFYTPELQEREEEIITARSRAQDLEYELFTQVRSHLADHTDQLQLVASHLARLDVLAGFAEQAAYNDYTRPAMAPAGSGISIEAGRHPVVEQTQDSFVANSTDLNREQYFAVLTGPNMSGKSTYLRQVALITILAQCGSFVPAEAARIGIIDRIFTRIGASDDITGGQSTFMVEMSEVADILDSATADSLVILDEVGRGTSTADGFALACAISRYLHDELQSFTLFATHHHELTDVIADFEHAHNLHFSADQRSDTVVFHYDISEGPATASYGVEVADEAGVPRQVIQDAKVQLSENHAASQSPPPTASNTDSEGHPSESQAAGLEVDPEVAALLESYEPAAITSTITEVTQADIVDMTPLEAIRLLDELQQRLD